MYYAVCSQEPVPRSWNGLVTRDAREKREFWEELDEFAPGLPEACGCYVVSVRNVVWYVGVTTRRSFRHECFAPHTITKIDEAITMGKGNAMLHLIPKKTPTLRFARPSQNGHKDAHYLETLLIGIALERNPDLLNKRDTEMLRNIRVPGFFNSDRGSGRANCVRELKRVMGRG